MSEDDFRDIWCGRTDTEEVPELALRLHQVIRPLLPGQQQAPAGVVLAGFCSDEGVRRNKGRVGARRAPDLLRKALANLPWASERAAYDAGNVVCEGEALEVAQHALASRVRSILADGHFPFVLGGGHEMAFGSWLGLFEYLESVSADVAAMPRIGIINFDAHFDLRPDSEGCSSGTPFYQIARHCAHKAYPFNYCCLGVSETANTAALFARARALGVSYRTDTQMSALDLDAARSQLRQFMDRCDLLYLTIDLDAFPASIAPGVSAPASRGVGLEIVEPLIEAVRESGKLRLADIAEYNPNFDIDNWTARLSARLFHCIVK